MLIMIIRHVCTLLLLLPLLLFTQNSHFWGDQAQNKQQQQKGEHTYYCFPKLFGSVVCMRSSPFL